MERTVEMEGGGSLEIVQDGLKVRLVARRPDDGKGLYKVWLRGVRKGKFLLGTLIPENGVLSASRVLSLRELERAVCWPQFWAECRLVFSFSKQENKTWYCEQQPQKFFSDPLIQKWIPGPMLCCREKNGFMLAAPFEADRPMMLLGLFCLVCVEKWPTGEHMVWYFDGRGVPKLPSKVTESLELNEEIERMQKAPTKIFSKK